MTPLPDFITQIIQFVDRRLQPVPGKSGEKEEAARIKHWLTYVERPLKATDKPGPAPSQQR